MHVYIYHITNQINNYIQFVSGGNLLEIPPINKTCFEGEEATFSCVAKDKETTIVWYKDGTPIQDLSDIRSRSSESEDGTLTIRSTTMYDLGEYECEIISSSGERQTARAFLDVQCMYFFHLPITLYFQ